MPEFSKDRNTLTLAMYASFNPSMAAKLRDGTEAQFTLQVFVNGKVYLAKNLTISLDRNVTEKLEVSCRKTSSHVTNFYDGSVSP